MYSNSPADIYTHTINFPAFLVFMVVPEIEVSDGLNIGLH